MKCTNILRNYSKRAIPVLDETIPIQAYIPLNLSFSNEKLKNLDIANHAICQRYIDRILTNGNGLIAYGGYLEKRPLYLDKPEFTLGGIIRNIHLGMDFWAKIGTKVVAPLAGKIHSFKNNSEHGDYGPTIILEHEINNVVFFTLYGHLSEGSLDGLYVDREFRKGETLATLGSPEVNVGYAPHLHFQIILDLHGHIGDYPGVCAEEDLDFYSKNCPDPNLLLNIHQ